MGKAVNGQIPKLENLKKGEIHIWTKNIDPEPCSIKTLSIDETKRANKFRSEPVREAFVQTRIALREILSKYLFVDPADIVFDYNRFGKPFLRQMPRPDPLYFNMSHSGNRSLIGLAAGQDIGIDLEARTHEFYGVREASLFCSEEEMIAISAVPKPALQDAFFNLWTRKEACVKAIGGGLSVPLKEISFSCGFLGNEFGRQGEKVYRFRDWSVKAISSEPGFSAAVAVKGEIGKVVFFEI